MANIPEPITLTTADVDGNQDSSGWVVISGEYEAVFSDTFGGATVTLQVYESASNEWISTGDTWTAIGVSRLMLSSGASHRFYLTTAGSGANIGVRLHRIQRLNS